MSQTALEFTIGDTWDNAPTWAVILKGDAVDLSLPNWSVRAQCRPNPDSSIVLFEWSTDNNRIIIGSATVTLSNETVLTTSTVKLTHTALESASLSPFFGDFDCEISNLDPGETYTIRSGTIRAKQDVTR